MVKQLSSQDKYLKSLLNRDLMISFAASSLKDESLNDPPKVH
jgi:hypothetical protein